MFVIQALMEITALFDDAVVPWDDKKLEDFLNIMHEEINGLHSCVSSVCVCIGCIYIYIYIYVRRVHLQKQIHFNNYQKSYFFIVYSN